MAVEKTLNTRILLKYDTYANWTANNPVLKKGEVAIATIPSNQDGVVNAPSTLIKVGDGTSNYTDLKFVSGSAADVYSWAKSATKPTYQASEITGLSTFISDYVDSEMGISVDTDTQYQLVKVNDYNYKLQSKGKTDGAWSDVAGSTIVIPNDTDAIAALSALVGDTSVASQITAAINAAKSELIGKDTDTASSDTIKGAKKHADSLNSAMDTRVSDLENAIGENGSVATQISTAIGKLDKSDTAVTGKYVSAVSETDGIITVTRANLPDYSNTYAAKSHNHAIADVTGLQTELNKVTTLIGSDSGKSARTIANEELAAQLIPDTAKESLDTLQEIAAWIQSHPDDASAMSSAIDALKELVGDSSVASQINTSINDLKNGDIKAATDRITTLEGKSHTHSNKALLDTYTQTEANLADAVSKKHSHANATELAKFASGDKAKLDTAVQSVTAGTGLTATKTGTNVAIGFDDTVTWIFDCGDSTTV